jgi:hypothetical protein
MVWDSPNTCPRANLQIREIGRLPRSPSSGGRISPGPGFY